MYNFRTQYFGLTNNELHLMRSQFAYKKVPFADINRIEIKKSIRTKHPIQLIIFGTTLLLFTLWLFQSQHLALLPNFSEDTESISGARGYAALITAAGFLVAISILSFSQVVIKRFMLLIELSDGSNELLPLTEIRKGGKTKELIQFLADNFNKSTFRFQSSILKGI